MYGSRESRIPYISPKGFFRRYSQSVESIFFFFTYLSDVGFAVYESAILADFTINGRYERTHNLLQCEYTYVNSLTSVWDTVYKLSEKFLMRFFKEFPNSFCEDVSLFCFLCTLLTKS